MLNIGRPSKYGNSALKTAQEYVEKCHKRDSIPYIEELALILDVNDDTISEWKKKYPEFSATIDRLKIMQRLALKRGALEKRFQSNIALFLLQTNHKQEEDLDTSRTIEVKFVSPEGARKQN